MDGEIWRSEILEGVDKVVFPGCVCGIIVIYGEKSHPIVVNKKGQVLCAAGMCNYYTPLHRRGYTVLPLSVVLPSVQRYFSSHFSQQLLMAEI